MSRHLGIIMEDIPEDAVAVHALLKSDDVTLESDVPASGDRYMEIECASRAVQNQTAKAIWALQIGACIYFDDERQPRSH